MVARLCVFCGSSSGSRTAYAEAAIELAMALGEAGASLVYGGARVGIMGILADAALENGVPVFGVIPEALREKELAHPGLTELHVTSDMHARKAKMAALADSFCALPGGIGTFEELFEIATWSGLGLHRKPIGLLNVEGFYDPFLDLIRNATKEGFVRPDQRDLFIVERNPRTLLARLEHHRRPEGHIWAFSAGA